MSETDTTPTPADVAEATAAQEAPQSPETFSKEYVQELRNEAARYRTQKNEAVEAVKATLSAEFDAKLAEKDVALAEVQNQLAEAQIELEKIFVAIDAQVPSEKVRAFAAILKGEDKDSLAESAKSAKELFGGLGSKSPAYDPTQGAGGGKPLALNGDPILEALKKAVGA